VIAGVEDETATDDFNVPKPTISQHLKMLEETA
jgi:Bacterial regulatory protein, arsR family